MVKKISGLLEGHVVKLVRSIYCYKNLNKNMFYNFKSKVPKDFALKSMDEDLYNKYASEIDPSYSDIWGSSDQFLERGFGFCILHNGEFISACNTFYVGHGCAEIDIMTKSEHRGQGFATITCSAFIEHCLNYELIPTWDADLGNEPSNKLALKLGFEKEKDISILWWHENAEIIKSYLTKYNY